MIILKVNISSSGDLDFCFSFGVFILRLIPWLPSKLWWFHTGGSQLTQSGQSGQLQEANSRRVFSAHQSSVQSLQSLQSEAVRSETSETKSHRLPSDFSQRSSQCKTNQNSLKHSLSRIYLNIWSPPVWVLIYFMCCWANLMVSHNKTISESISESRCSDIKHDIAWLRNLRMKNRTMSDKSRSCLRCTLQGQSGWQAAHSHYTQLDIRRPFVASCVQIPCTCIKCLRPWYAVSAGVFNRFQF